MKIYEIIGNYYNISAGEIRDIVDSSAVRYCSFYVDKKRGGRRKIVHPRHELKLIQYWLVREVFSKMNHESNGAFAYLKGRDIKKNALVHVRNSHFLSLDFRDFYGSLTFSMLKPYLKKIVIESDLGITLEGLTKIVKKACFDKHGKLPIGFVTSSIISNIIMFEFDNEMIDVFNEEKDCGRVFYTRYADDVTISSNKDGVVDNLFKLFSKKLKEDFSGKIKLNTKKTKVRHKRSGNVLITGLRVTKDSRVTLHRKYKERVKKLLNDNYASEKIGVLSEVLGHLNYIKYVDPSFAHKLNIKFFEKIKQVKLSYKKSFNEMTYLE